MPFWPHCVERGAILFRPGNRDGVIIWENFHPGCRDLGWNNRDLSNRASPSSHMYTPKSRKPGQPGQPGSCEEALDYLIRRM